MSRFQAYGEGKSSPCFMRRAVGCMTRCRATSPRGHVSPVIGARSAYDHLVLQVAQRCRRQRLPAVPACGHAHRIAALATRSNAGTAADRQLSSLIGLSLGTTHQRWRRIRNGSAASASLHGCNVHRSWSQRQTHPPARPWRLLPNKPPEPPEVKHDSGVLTYFSFVAAAHVPGERHCQSWMRGKSSTSPAWAKATGKARTRLPVLFNEMCILPFRGQIISSYSI